MPPPLPPLFVDENGSQEKFFVHRSLYRGDSCDTQRLIQVIKDLGGQQVMDSRGGAIILVDPTSEDFHCSQRPCFDFRWVEKCQNSRRRVKMFDFLVPPAKPAARHVAFALPHATSSRYERPRQAPKAQRDDSPPQPPAKVMRSGPVSELFKQWIKAYVTWAQKRDPDTPVLSLAKEMAALSGRRHANMQAILRARQNSLELQLPVPKARQDGDRTGKRRRRSRDEGPR